MTLAFSFSCVDKSENSDLNSAAVALVTQNQSSSSATTANTSTGTCATTGFCKIFATAATAIKTGGISGFDNQCQNDTNKPSGGGTYKALASDGVNRRACSTANCSTGVSENIGWVLKPNKEYRRKDGTTVIGTTNASGIFTFPLTNSMEIISNLVVTNGIATGFVSDWTSSANDCLDWTSNAGGNLSTTGTWTSTNSGAIDGGGTSGCSNTHMLVCVEQ
nr:DUF1554 domain-containing protein [Leptospira mtsangambouensis]